MSVPGTLNYPSSLDDTDSLLKESNNVSTTLTGAHNNSITTITVGSTTGFPSTGAISIDDEIIYYTGVGATTFTGAIRGSDGSTAASHSGGASVEGRIIARHSSILRDAIIAIQTKIGIGASTPVTNSIFAGTATGVSGWTTTPRLEGIGLGVAGASSILKLTDFTFQQSIGSADAVLATSPDAAAVNLVGPQTLKLASVAQIAYSTSPGDYRQIHAWVDNTGTGNTVGGSFGVRITGAGFGYGINPWAYANNAGATVQAIEADFGSLIAGGTAYGIVIVNTGTQNTAAPFLQLQTSANNKTAGDGIRISGASGQPIASTGAMLKSVGAVSVSYGIDFTSATCSVAAFRSTGFTVDSTGQLGLGVTSLSGLAHFKGGPQWGSFNYGATLVIDGTRHNSIGLLDSTSANPWAVTNLAGVFTLSTMPALGNTATAPVAIWSLSAAGKMTWLTGSATATAGAATLNSPTGIITSESLTTAGLAAYTLTLTNSYIGAASNVMVTVFNGTNTQGTIVVGKVTPASGSVAILIQNVHASQALNGTIKISFISIG